MKTHLKIIAALLCAAACSTTVQAAVTAYEPFNYASGGFPSGTASTATGFTGNWTNGGTVTIVTGLTNSGLPTTANAFQQSNNGVRSAVNFASPLSSGTEYLSFLVKGSGNPGGNSVGVFLKGDNATSLFAGFHSPLSADLTGFGLGSVTSVSVGATGASPFGSTINISNAIVHLIVLQIDFNTSGVNDTINLWINPPAGTNSPGVAANVTYSSYDVGNISGMGLNLQGGSPNFSLDEIRRGSSYGDVVGANVAPPTPTIPTTIAISQNPGKQVSWIASSTNSYQPQKSGNNSTWTNLGGLLAGSTVTSVYDVAPVDFYRVLELTFGGSGSDQMVNGSFEIPAVTNVGAANWTGPAASIYESVWVTNQYGSLTPVSGTNLLFMEGATAAVTPAAPNTYLTSDLFPVTGGLSYNVKFNAANPVKNGGGNPQYRVRFYDAGNAFLSEEWRSFASAGSTWTLFSVTNTAPVNAAQMELFFIQAVGAGASWDWVSLIDDVSVNALATFGPTNALSATVQPGASFTATVKTNGVTATAATGTVTFLTNSVALSTNGVAAGTANSATAILSPPYTVTAIYSGDGTYIGSTNSLLVAGSYFGPGSGSVTLTGGNATVVLSGIEGYNYVVQRATNVLFTLGVSNFPTATAPVGGQITVTDNFSDLGAVPGAAFYRLQYIP